MSESKIRINAENLHALAQGRAGVAINAAIAQILTDLDQRGDDEKERRAVITLAAGRVKNSNEHIYLDVRVKTSLPSLDSGSTVAELRFDGRSGVAEFRGDSPERPDQPSIPWPNKAEGEVDDEEVD